MKLVLQPDIYNDVTTLASLADTAAVSIEYEEGALNSSKVYLALLSDPPSSDEDAQATMICDLNSPSRVRTVQGVTGQKVYAWFSSTSTQTGSITVLVG